MVEVALNEPDGSGVVRKRGHIHKGMVHRNCPALLDESGVTRGQGCQATRTRRVYRWVAAELFTVFT